MIFIGVQSYILRYTTRETRTRGGTIIVYGYNGGTLSGAAIGAMLALYIGRQGVFILGAIVGLIILAYSLRYITSSAVEIEKPAAAKTKLRSLLGVFSDFSFLKTVILVGIPTKIILTGITVYALPLLLASLAFRQEDIGQIMMFYAAGVLLSSRFVSRLTDRLGKTRIILFIGMLGAGAGLVLTGLMKWEPLMALSLPYLSALVVMAGMFILGFSHGFIHAPIVTHIAETRAARTLGPAAVTSFYRFLERLGHVTGPLIISSILLAMNDSTLAISVVGFTVIILGVLFMAGAKGGSKDSGVMKE
jgi:predicted MFS family arabinose efflux permease